MRGWFNIKKLTVATIVGTRPEVIRLSRVISVLSRDTSHVLIHTGQNYDPQLNDVFFDDLKIARPDISLNAARDTPIRTIAAILEGAETALLSVRPDAVLVLGDTNSGLSLIAAKRLMIPSFHMEAGNRCFDPRVPEEVNRKIIDHVADINLPYSSIAREYLLREGVAAEQIIVTGSPMAEVLHYYHESIESSEILETLNLKEKFFYAVSLHREENVDKPERLRKFVNMLNSLATDDGLPIVMSTHPRTRSRLTALDTQIHPLVRLLNPLSFSEFVHLQTRAMAVLSDSGTISEEASILGLKAVNLRDTNERPEAMEQASVMMVGASLERLHQALAILKTQGKDSFSQMNRPIDYGHVNVAEKVSRIIHSYVDVVRQKNRLDD